jgi:hypothetical protein
MRKLFGGLVLAALALSVSTAAQAQRRSTGASMGGAKHELGVDLSAAYVDPGAAGVDGGITIISPVDVRFGIIPRAGSKLMWEPRLAFSFSSVGGNTAYALTPTVRGLYSNSPGGHRRGMYFAGGAGLVLGDPSGTASGTAFKLEAGVGWRKPYGSGAWRYEVGFQWVSSNDNLAPFLLADYFAIGGRIGISLWH